MKIYIVIIDNGSRGSKIYGVFNSNELAIKYIEDNKLEYVWIESHLVQTG